MKRQIEQKGVIPDSQAGFRKGKGTMDNVYILVHLIKSKLKEKRARMFIDLRAAFDKVDREKIFECMREKNKRMAGTED
jgi:hypothetical protein